MGQCLFNALQTQIINGRSATGYADNDWVTLVVTVNGQVVVNQAMPLHNPKFYGQSQDNIFTGGDTALPFGTSVQCADTDTVICFFSIFNLSSFSWGDQASAAAKTVQSIGDEIAKIYFDAAQLVLKIAAGVSSAGISYVGCFGHRRITRRPGRRDRLAHRRFHQRRTDSRAR